MTLRGTISRKILYRMEKSTPQVFRRFEIQVLTSLCARSFGRQGRRVWTLPSEQALKEYARFTVECMENPADEEKLFLNARRLGERVRRVSGLKDPEDLKRLVFLLYRNINITMRGELPGQVTVPGCYFSHYYTPDHCALMSCVDSGIVSGICGGESLDFSQRITEGSACCMACLCMKEGEEK